MKDEVLEQYFTANKSDFNHLDERFNSIDRRFDVIEDKLNRIELVAYAILEIIKGHDTKFLGMEKRIFRLENKAI